MSGAERPRGGIGRAAGVETGCPKCTSGAIGESTQGVKDVNGVGA